jgi:hypothetical protein
MAHVDGLPAHRERGRPLQGRVSRRRVVDDRPWLVDNTTTNVVRSNPTGTPNRLPLGSSL